MRILHISSVYPPHVVGGAERVVEMLAREQARRGHEVGAACLARGAEAYSVQHGVTVMPQASRNLLWMEDVFRAPRPLRTANKIGQMLNYHAARDFGRAIARFAPDVVHSHSMVELPPMIWDEAGKAGARVVHTLHDYDLLCSRASLFRHGQACAKLHPSCKVASWWKGRFVRRIEAVASVSPPVLAEHRRFGLFDHLPRDKLRVIGNAVPVQPRTGPRPTSSGPFRFGFLGRLVPEKGISTLMEACRLLPTSGWELHVAGRAQEGDEAYRAQAEGLPVTFRGFCDATAFLDSIDLLVVPSIWREPFGLTVVEAFARGVPVIGSRVGAIATMVGAVGDGWLFAPGDHQALANRMVKVLRGGRDGLPPHTAFAPVLEAASLEHMTDGYDALYRQVVA